MTQASHPLAIALMPLENRWQTILYTAKRADELGYDMFSMPETWSYDVTTLLANIAAETKNIQLGATILSVWSRSAATLAMLSASMQVVSGRRFVLGLGASTPQIVEGLHDTAYTAPYKQMRQVLSQLRALMQAERIPLSDVETARPLRLNVPSFEAPPVVLGASSSYSIKLAGELCDGWIPFLYPLEQLHTGIELFNEGRQASHNPERPLHIYPSLPVSVHEDADKAREGAAWFVAFYVTTMGDLYRGSLRRMGYAQEVDAIMEANRDRHPAIVPPEAEALLEQLTIFGTPDQAQAQLKRWAAIGDYVKPALMLPPNLSNEQINFILEALIA